MTKKSFFISVLIGTVIGLLLVVIFVPGKESSTTSWENCHEMSNGRISCERPMP